MTALRVFVGLSMAFAHGLGKIPPSAGFISGIRDMRFPLPEVFAWLATGAEFLGGLFLALGLLTRPSAFLVATTMAVAAFLRHGPDPYTKKELALLYLVISLVFMFRGAGRWSLDRFLSR